VKKEVLLVWKHKRNSELGQG